MKPISYANGGMDLLDATFAALADPTRRAILAGLASGEASVAELAEPFAMNQPAISKHLKVLERAGLISRGRDKQRRPCRLEARSLKAVAEWAENYRHFWDASFERLDGYLQQMKEKEWNHGRRQIGLGSRRLRHHRIGKSSRRASWTHRAGSFGRLGPTRSTCRTGCLARKAGPCRCAKSTFVPAGLGASSGADLTAPRWRCAAYTERLARPSGSSTPTRGAVTGPKRSTRWSSRRITARRRWCARFSTRRRRLATRRSEPG